MPPSKNQKAKPKTKVHKNAKSKKTKAPVEVAPVEVAPVEVAPVEVASADKDSHPHPHPHPVDEAEGPTVAHEFDTFLKELKTMKQSIVDMITNVSKLQKRVAKESRKGKKNTRASNGNKNNGFSKPVCITSELCQFLGLEKGELIARTEVTKGITKYIKEHQLQDDKDKRIIHADSKLEKLLNQGDKKLTSDIPLTYFNLQTYLKCHYPKPVQG